MTYVATGPKYGTDLTSLWKKNIGTKYFERNKTEGIMQNTAICQSLLNYTFCFRVGER